MDFDLFFIVVQTSKGLRRIRIKTRSMVNVPSVEGVTICGVYAFNHAYLQVGGKYFGTTETTWQALSDPLDTRSFLGALTPLPTT